MFQLHYVYCLIHKAEREMGLLLSAAQKEAPEDDNLDAVRELRHVGQVYINYCEVTVISITFSP